MALTMCLAIVNQSCTDLEEEIFSQVTADNFFQSDEEFISALGAAYTTLYGMYGTPGVIGIQEISARHLVVPTRGQDWDDGGHWRRLHQQEWNSEDPATNGAWGVLFGGVSTCNRLIFQFEQLNNPSTTPFLSELKALRAVYYYWLLDIYGNVPIITSFDVDPASITQSTRAEVYNFVESELTGALSNVTSAKDGSTYGRVNQDVINTALTKLYLNAEVYTGTAQWSKAAAAAQAVISTGNYSLTGNYRDNFITDNSGSSEFIFAIPYDKVFAGGFATPAQTLHYASQATYNLTFQPWNGWSTLEDFYKSYEDGDVRQANNHISGPQFSSGGERLMDDGAEPFDVDGPPLTFTPEINELGPNACRQCGARIGKFEFALGSTNNLSNDFPLFRYADVLLMRAEALWRMNPGDAEALDLFNQIRTRAGLAAATEITADALLDERGHELFMEGHARTDEIRFGRFLEARWEKAAQEECKTLFPIPKSQIDANANFSQNPCYN
jgi:hypothetical protein